MNQENIKIVQKAYNDFKNGNIEGILNSLTEDIEWELPSIPNVPFSGKRIGRDRVGQFFVMLSECQDNLMFEPSQFIADEEKVVSLGNYRWRVKSTGKTFECAFAHVFTIRNGKVVKFLEFTDTALASNAYAS
jgi:ketosteroid isomerase-like protein